MAVGEVITARPPPLQADLDEDIATVYAASDGRLPAAEWVGTDIQTPLLCLTRAA